MAPTAPPPPAPSLGDYARTILAHGKLVAAITAVALLAGLAAVLIAGQQVTARTDLNLNVISTDPFNGTRSASGLVDAQTEVQIARSSSVAEAAAAELGDITPQELRRAADVELAGEGTVIRVSYTADTAEQATERSDAIAAAYLDYRAAQAEERRQSLLQQVDERLEDLRQQLADANARAGSAQAGSSGANQAESDRQIITLEIDGLLAERSSLDLIDTSGGSVLSSADSNQLEYSPNRLLVLASALLVGLALGVVAAFAVNQADRRIRSAQDSSRFLGSRELAHLTAEESAVPAVGPDAELYRSIREQLLAQTRSTVGSLAIVDDTAGPLPSDVALNLAVALVESELPARLLLPGFPADAVELIRARLGLELISQGPSGSVYSPQAHPGLRVVVPVGTTTAGGDVLITAEVAEQLTTAAATELVLIALPPGSSHAARLAVARISGAVLYVVELGRSLRTVVAADAAAFELLGTPVLGTVLVARGRRLPPLGDEETPPPHPARPRAAEPPRTGAPVATAPRPPRARRRPSASTAAAEPAEPAEPATAEVDPAESV